MTIATLIDSTQIEKPTAYINTGSTYKGIVAIIPNVANLSGSTGAAVTTAVSFTEIPGLPTNLNYTVEISANQPAAYSWSSKSATGFNVVLTPLSSSGSISAGLFDVIVRWAA